jgi:anthranilate phosphoribosyltransferase
MKRVVGIRRQLGHRTVFNMLGPLTNPAGAAYQIIGVYAPELTEKLALALSELGCRRAWVVHSHDGLDEFSVAAPTRVSEIFNGTVRSFDVDPSELGIASSSPSDLAGGTPEENAAITRGILEGTIMGAKRDIVMLNAAAALHVAGRGELSEAIALARDAIDSGNAIQILEGLVEESNG